MQTIVLFCVNGQNFDTLLASAYHCLNPYYVLREETRGSKKVIIKENVKVSNYAAGFSMDYKKWEFHGECLFNFSYRLSDK